jgi:parallel beta-helix repeat protein
MLRKALSALLFFLLLAGIATLSFRAQPVNAIGTIYIRPDGSIDPPNATISSSDNSTYTITADINGSIVVERSNITIEGADYTVQGTGAQDSEGILLSEVENVNISSVSVKGFVYGVYANWSSSIMLIQSNLTDNSFAAILLYFSSNNTIFQNRLMNTRPPLVNESRSGIEIYESSHNTITENTIANNVDGIGFYECLDNLIQENDIKNNTHGVFINSASQNTICHNNLTDNIKNALIMNFGPTNYWDDGQSLGGNYWEDYTGTDTNGDGIGDTSYAIDANNIDHYPLISPCKEWIPTQISSLSTNTPSTYIGFTANISGILTDPFGTPLKDKTVVLSYTFSGSTTFTPITSCNTGIGGSFSAEWITQATGYFIIKAEWSGNATHFMTSSEVALTTLPYENAYIFSVESNSTISNLTFDSNSSKLSFSVSGEKGTFGYAKVTIGKNLVANIADLKIQIDGNEYNYTLTDMNDSWVLLFNYTHSTHQVEVSLKGTVPEFSPVSILFLFVLTAFLGLVIFRRRAIKKPPERTNHLRKINAIFERSRISSQQEFLKR